MKEQFEALITSFMAYIESVLPLIIGALISAAASYGIYRFNLKNANRKTELSDLKRILGIIIQMETLKSENLIYVRVNQVSSRVSDSMMNLVIKLNQEVATNSNYRDTDFNKFYTHLHLVEGDLDPLKKDILEKIKQVESKLKK